MAHDGTLDILILADYREIGELMAALVELSGHSPVTPRGDETAADAIRRVRPPVVLIEWDHEQAGSPPVLAATREVGCATLLFSGSRSADELEQLARRCGLLAIAFPVERDAFRRSLESAITMGRRR